MERVLSAGHSRIASANRRIVDSKLVGYLIGANEPCLFMAEHELDELSKH
jgi:hypothetical protein